MKGEKKERGRKERRKDGLEGDAGRRNEEKEEEPVG